MRIMGQAAESGNDNGHSDTLEPGDTDWLAYKPANSWTINLAGVAKQAMRMTEAVEPEAPALTPEQEAAETRAYLSRHGIFWDVPASPAAPAAPVTKRHRALVAKLLDWPPGFAGELARYVYAAAPRPVKEVAIVAAIGLLAGICARQWQIPKSGLNVYLVLIARSAIGKEAMHQGIGDIREACKREFPAAELCADFTEYASGPALIKACLANPCFVNVSGELGRRVKAIAQAKPNDALNTLRTQWTNLYHKSSATSVTGGIGYSNTENNVASITGAAYSLIGETTPGTFLEALTSEMMEDGFMSRFTLVEYEGERPEQNHAPLDAPPQALVRRVLDLMSQADQMRTKGQFLRVERDMVAGVSLDLFNLECDRRINSYTDEARRQLWNRAHLKVLRIAALLAVADNHMFPVIRLAHAEWAINLVLRDIATFSKRLDRGDVGNGDDAREGKLASILREYQLSPVPASYRVPDAMNKANIVPLHYLQKRTQHAPAFARHPFQAKRALDDTLGGMVSAGYLIEVPKDKVAEAYNYHGKAYRILRIPDSDQ